MKAFSYGKARNFFEASLVAEITEKKERGKRKRLKYCSLISSSSKLSFVEHQAQFHILQLSKKFLFEKKKIKKTHDKNKVLLG